MRIAALDCGSNSFHLIVADVETGGRIQILDRAKELVRLGDSTLHTGVIPPELFRRALDALKFLRRIADRHKPDALVAVATSAVREAQNGGEFVRAARDEVGVDIRVIRGDEEARLIYLGARGSLDLGKRRVAMFDLGGGSLEIVLADAQELYFTASLKLGVIRLSEACPVSDPPTPRERAQLAERARSMLEPVIARVRAMGFDFVALTAGTASALASLLEIERERPGSQRTATLPTKSLVELEKRLGAMRASERARLPGLDARRADTIYTGAVVLRTVLELTGVAEASLCETALREGLIADYVATNRPGILLVEEFPDLRRRSVMELARRCQFREPHATHVARLALSIFDQTRRLHGLAKGDAELLEYAALLHDIGFHVAPNRHHRHTEYLIQSHDMSGFSREEIDIIALVARYHRKAEPSKNHDAYAALSKADRNRVRQLTAILRVADGLDRTDARLIRSVRCVVTDKTIEMRLDADGDPELELWAARRKGDLLEKLTKRKLRLTVDAVLDQTNDGNRLRVVR
jgi:exopolyphosphatase/guanosine-5'-triphosphate,3'-diphosphate pyrophosphatase